MRARIFAALLLASALARAGTQVINYQGQLTTPSGLAVADGNYSMGFEIYDHPTSVTITPLWSTSATLVPLQKGLFNVEFDVSTLSAASLNSALYLQVIVAGEYMTPRKRLLASAFSLNANYLQGRQPGSSAGETSRRAKHQCAVASSKRSQAHSRTTIAPPGRTAAATRSSTSSTSRTWCRDRLARIASTGRDGS